MKFLYKKMLDELLDHYYYLKKVITHTHHTVKSIHSSFHLESKITHILLNKFK